MATAHIKPASPLLPTQPPQKTVEADWLPGNPWLWVPLGLCLATLAFAWVRLFGDTISGVRFALLLCGLLAAGGGLAIQLRSPRAYLSRLAAPTQNLLLAILFMIYAGLVLVVSGLAIACGLEAFGFDWWRPSEFGWRVGGAVVVWFVVVPASVAAAQTLLQRMQKNKQISASEESSLLLVLCGLALFAACWALYVPGRPMEWDTMRLLFAVFAAVALLGSLLPVLPLNARLTLVSGLILLHFGGICTATLSAPPFAWITAQLWTRVYRPYLEFMYLNNAYHFYSPEPGPASYVWFRLIYTTVDEKDGKEYEHLDWVKWPDLDENGLPRYVAGLTYQRYLSFTENVSHSETRPMQFMSTDGIHNYDFYQRRLDASMVGPVVVGKERRRHWLIVPFANIGDVPISQQYALPTLSARRLIGSFARHACKLPMQGVPEAKIKEKRVKVYRVTHSIPYTETFRNGQDPQDPQLYRAFFVGEYDADGELIDREEPFLYWLLPNLPEQSSNRNSPIISYVRKHARDPYCKYLPDTKEWVKETP